MGSHSPGGLEVMVGGNILGLDTQRPANLSLAPRYFAPFAFFLFVHNSTMEGGLIRLCFLASLFVSFSSLVGNLEFLSIVITYA